MASPIGSQPAQMPNVIAPLFFPVAACTMAGMAVTTKGSAMASMMRPAINTTRPGATAPTAEAAVIRASPAIAARRTPMPNANDPNIAPKSAARRLMQER